MRLYGSQSRISRSATRYARAHRPLSGSASVPQTQRRPVSVRGANRTRRVQEPPATPSLIPRSA